MGRQAAVVLYVLALVAVVVRRGRPVLQEPVLGGGDSERGMCPGVRGVGSEVPEASVSAAAAMRAFNASGKVQARYRRPARFQRQHPCAAGSKMPMPGRGEAL